MLSSFSADFSYGITCLRGASGGGKTTLLRVLAGLQKPDSGLALEPFRRPAFMFQEDRLFPWLTAAQKYFRRAERSESSKSRFVACGSRTGGEENSYPGQLSGGMQRRVALARTLAYQGDALLLDEPFKGLDPPLVRQSSHTTCNPPDGARHCRDPFGRKRSRCSAGVSSIYSD